MRFLMIIIAVFTVLPILPASAHHLTHNPRGLGEPRVRQRNHIQDEARREGHRAVREYGRDNYYTRPDKTPSRSTAK